MPSSGDAQRCSGYPASHHTAYEPSEHWQGEAMANTDQPLKKPDVMILQCLPRSSHAAQTRQCNEGFTPFLWSTPNHKVQCDGARGRARRGTRTGRRALCNSGGSLAPSSRQPIAAQSGARQPLGTREASGKGKHDDVLSNLAPTCGFLGRCSERHGGSPLTTVWKRRKSGSVIMKQVSMDHRYLLEIHLTTKSAVRFPCL